LASKRSVKRSAPTRGKKPSPATRSSSKKKAPPPRAKPPAKAPAKPSAAKPKPPVKVAKKPAPAPVEKGREPPVVVRSGDARRHVLSLSFLRDGDEFLARLESDSGQITELKNRSLDQLLTLVASELEDLLE
jgi:hypothetical protein